MQNTKHLSALVTYLWLIPLVYFVPSFIASFLPDNRLLVIVVSLTLIVPSMIYCIVPLTVKGLLGIIKAIKS